VDELSFSDLELRQIIWASILDPQERNRKVRPAIVIEQAIDDEGIPFCWVLGGTTQSVDNRRIAYTVELEGYSRGNGVGHPQTGLMEDTRFCAFWIQPVYKEHVKQSLRKCPENEYLQLIEMLRELERGKL